MKRTLFYSIGLLSLTGISTVFLLGGVHAQDASTQTKMDTAKITKADTLQSAQPNFVLELFTSQGCSSCPPANRFVADMSQSRDDVLVLSYGVTYWDYLGWKDTFGDPRFTERQRDYGKYLGSNNYTPQIVLNGSAHSPRYSKNDVTSMPLQKIRPAAALSLNSKNELIVTADTIEAGHRLSLVRFQPGSQNVAVKRGENSGRTLAIENVVLDVDVTEWRGSPFTVMSELEAGQTYAALFHAPESKRIVTAALLSPQ
jgi:hypothetical protein